MEHTNVLDSEEQERSFLYGNRSLYCLGGSMLFLGTTSLVLDYIQENNFSRTVEMGFIMTPFVVMGIVALGGCYFGVQGIRYRENKRWRSVLGLLSNLSLVLLFCFTMTLVLFPHRSAPDTPPMLQEVEQEVIILE